jgi:nucleoside-diphosphate-sugar epimerase
MDRKKILITGHLGYVGPGLIKYLRNNYSDSYLMGFDIGYFGTNVTTTNILPEVLLDQQYFGDIRNFPEEILSGVDAVIHLSAISNDPMSNQFSTVTNNINFKASIALAQKAKKMGVKNFVFASSCSVYGFAEDGDRVESSTLNPLTAYAKSKVQAEEDLYSLSNSNFIVTCLRFATACGMSDRLRLDLVINDFVASALINNNITILSDGTPWRPLINTLDMARAISWAMNRNELNGGEFLVVNTGSNAWNYQVRDIATFVKQRLPNTFVHINSNAQPDKRSYRVNFDLFKKLAPDFYPQYTIEQTIEELILGLTSIKFRDNDFRNSELIRINKLNSLKNNNFINENLIWIR